MTEEQAKRCFENRVPVVATKGSMTMEGQIVGHSSGMGGTTFRVQSRQGSRVLERVPASAISPAGGRMV